MNLPRTLLVGHDSSPYIHKLRMYFAWRAIPFEEVQSRQQIYSDLITPRTGGTQIPVVVLDEKTVIGDSGRIMDHFESLLAKNGGLAKSRVPNFPLQPTTPRQAFVSNLFEFMSEEWLFFVGFSQRQLDTLRRFGPLDLHEEYLLNMVGEGSGRPTNLFAGRERARQALEMGFLRALKPWGVTPETLPKWNESLERTLIALSKHFDKHRFLLSDTHPCRGDFALAGQLSGFFARDPQPSFILKTKAPNLERYIARMLATVPRAAYESPTRITALDGASDPTGTVRVTRANDINEPAWLPNDHIPETLFPALTGVLDLVTHVERVHALAVKYAAKKVAAGTSGTSVELPRAVGYPEFTMQGEVVGTRMAQVFSLYAWQRLWVGGVHVKSDAVDEVVRAIARAAANRDEVVEVERVRDVARLVDSTPISRIADKSVIVMDVRSVLAEGGGSAKL
ncbi:hypothetical protein BCR44DRAFT_48851 [Catenaria anguillulae PL171]|uniref:GST C-terminal domain-containing protein n=1 Tax=Catenaria anguillulae PL171 TaxID=765915 RepID=A0A1Y2HIV9_9FUNG|nr:hypothetical protein BCR44DRAFT_48851 [Catenaria anguillulae PL171]